MAILCNINYLDIWCQDWYFPISPCFVSPYIPNFANISPIYTWFPAPFRHTYIFSEQIMPRLKPMYSNDIFLKKIWDFQSFSLSDTRKYSVKTSIPSNKSTLSNTCTHYSVGFKYIIRKINFEHTNSGAFHYDYTVGSSFQHLFRSCSVKHCPPIPLSPPTQEKV